MIADIKYYSQMIIHWIGAYFGNEKWLFLLFTVIAFVYLYVTCKKLRYKLLLPIGAMMVVVCNPILYKYVFTKIIYWRLLWLLPGAILVATAVVILLKQIKKTWMKWGLVILFTTFVLAHGENVFKEGGFETRSNWEKISQETIDVCHIMLELDETPKAVVHSSINTQVRQYAPEIQLMYGREASMPGYIRNVHEPEYSVYCALKEDPINFDYALQVSSEYGYNFFVVSINTPVDEMWLLEYGYEEVGRTEEHIVYYNSSIVD